MQSYFENIIIEEEVDSVREYASDAASSLPAVSSSGVYDLPQFDFEIVKAAIIFKKRKMEEGSEDKWFMEPSWLKGEEEADNDILNGRCYDFQNADEAISFLRRP